MNTIVWSSALIIQLRIYLPYQILQFKTSKYETLRRLESIDISKAVLSFLGLIFMLYSEGWGEAGVLYHLWLFCNWNWKHSIFFPYEKFCYRSFNWNFISKEKKSSFRKITMFSPRCRGRVQKHTMKLKFLKVPLKSLLQLL